MAILTDLQQQVSDLTGAVEAQQSTLADLTVIMRSQHDTLRQLLPDGAVPPAALSAATSRMPSVVPAMPAAAGRSGGV